MENENGRLARREWAAVCASRRFESMLDSWFRDRDAWPKNRDYEMFQKWFEVRICSVVEDLFLSQPLQHEN